MSVPASQLPSTDPSSTQTDPSASAPPDWAAISGLASPPPVDPSADPQLIASILGTQPPDQPLSPGAPPLTPTQQQDITEDLISQRGADQDLLKKYETDLDKSQEEEEQLTDAEVQTLGEQPPQPPAPPANPLQRMAPLLMMSAFGGKATKMDAGLMLAATTGTVQGFLQGNEQAVASGQKQYEEAYKQFKDRQDQQLKIFDTLREAYKGQPDADLRALTMARNMTGDEGKIDQQLLEMQSTWSKGAQQLEEHNQAMKEQSWYQRATIAARAKAADKTSQGSQPLNSDQLETLARQAIITGKDPTFGMGASANRTSYLAAKADLIKQMGGAGSATQLAASVAAAKQSLNAQMKQASAIGTFENTANANLDLAVQEGKKLATGGSPLINRAILAWRQHITGDPQTAKFVNALTVAKNEYEKVISGSTGAAGLTDAARREGDELFNKVNSQETLEAQVAIAKQEMHNRISSFSDTIGNLQSQISGIEQPQPPPATTQPSSAGKTVIQTGMLNGKKVVKYSDGTVSYAK